MALLLGLETMKQEDSQTQWSPKERTREREKIVTELFFFRQ